MVNNGIEDILISRDYNNKKNKSKGFFGKFFILLIIASICLGLYWYFTKETKSSKQLFVQNVSKINVNNLLNNNIYRNLLSRLQTQSSQINSSVRFTTDLENEELQDIDVTKFKLDVLNSNDVTSKKNYNEAILNYSGNEVFKVNLVTSENEIAIASNEILNQYVGIHFDKINEVFGVNIDIDYIKELEGLENINITEDELNQYVKKYFEIILNNISEEKFSVQENIAIENAIEDVEVTNYSVTLTQEELNNLLIKTLEELKNDDELIKKIVSAENNEDITTENNFEITTSNTQNENTEQNGESDVEKEQSENIIVENGQVEDDQNIINSSVENLEPEIPVIQINPVGTINATPEESTISTMNSTDKNETKENTEISQNSEIVANTNENEDVEIIQTNNIDELIEQENNGKEELINIIFGKKVNLTKKQLQDIIDNTIKEIEKISGNGIKINVYASETNVEKIDIVLPNNNILDIDLFPDDNSELNSNQSYIKVTYLYKDEETSEKNGFALELKKQQSNASTSINSEYSFIENEKINKKVKLNLKTEGTTNSKEINNEAVFTISTNRSETQVAIDNQIQFKDVSDLPGLNAENCIYLDLLPENERDSLIDTIKTQLTNLYTSKKENLSFIDTNTYSQTTLENQNSNQSQTSKVTREEAKNALITKVSNMMQEAIDKNEEFTIQNLRDLKIDGYKVSAAVTAESALIVVDVYKFNIDTNFMLTDIE